MWLLDKKLKHIEGRQATDTNGCQAYVLLREFVLSLTYVP